MFSIHVSIHIWNKAELKQTVDVHFFKFIVLEFRAKIKAKKNSFNMILFLLNFECLSKTINSLNFLKKYSKEIQFTLRILFSI